MELVPADEQRSTRHLFRQRQFGKDIFHCLVLRAATLEAALVRAGLPTKDATIALQEHFQHEFVNAARALYTQVLLEGGAQNFHLLSRLSPPPQLQVWEPDEHGLPRSWPRPWTRQGTPAAPLPHLSTYSQKSKKKIKKVIFVTKIPNTFDFSTQKPKKKLVMFFSDFSHGVTQKDGG